MAKRKLNKSTIGEMLSKEEIDDCVMRARNILVGETPLLRVSLLLARQLVTAKKKEQGGK